MRSNYLDALKAFAIIAVVLYHSGFSPYGYLGVDIFLVVAGYLTTKSLNNRLIKANRTIEGGNNRSNYISFELSRVERLLPPLIIAGIVCMSIGFFVMIDDTYESLSQSVIATNFFGNNIVELIATGNYWANDKIFSPLMHTWYVGLVMQFYLIFPLLFFCANLDKKTPEKTLLKILAVLAFVSLLAFLGEEDTARRFYLLPPRFFEFAVGGMVALKYKSTGSNAFGKVFVYSCYALLLLLLVINKEILSSDLRLLVVVALSAVLICSQRVLENIVTGNKYLAKIGAASYSIFVWHQVVLAFYRSCFGSHYDLLHYTLCLLIIALLSWLSYIFIEQRTGELLKSFRGKRRLFIVYGTLFVALNVFTLYIYKQAGVVRDIPELEVSISHPQRGMWPQYNDRVFDWDRPFVTEKRHWMVIGNSYARDFSNIVSESSFANEIEVSYCEGNGGNYKKDKYDDRFRTADKIFIASKDFTEEMVREVEIRAMAFGHSIDDVIIVGEKDFGETMTQVYIRRFKEDYFDTYVWMKAGFLERNDHFKKLYGDRYMDLISIVRNKEGKVRAFSEDGMLISSDCSHLTKSGARFFAQKLSLDRYLK